MSDTLNERKRAICIGLCAALVALEDTPEHDVGSWLWDLAGAMVTGGPMPAPPVDDDGELDFPTLGDEAPTKPRP